MHRAGRRAALRTKGLGMLTVSPRSGSRGAHTPEFTQREDLGPYADHRHGESLKFQRPCDRWTHTKEEK